MRRLEMIALRCTGISWESLAALLPPALEALGLAHDPGGADGEISVDDHGDNGRIVHLDNSRLARRAAVALAVRSGGPVQLFEVIATSGGKHFRFRTEALLATAKGELKPAEGKELDLDDPAQTWGGGTLLEQAERVLEEFALLDSGPARTLRLGYKKKPAGRPSTPRVATLLAYLQKSKSHEAIPQPDGRVELRIELSAGGRQTSYCSAAEHEELEKLIGGGKG